MIITTRNTEQRDAQAVAVLSAQLGYPVTEEEASLRISLISQSPDDTAFVALYDNEVIAWIHVFYTLRIESAAYCEVGGLVTDERYRGRGVGKELLEKAKEWCKTKNCIRLVVRSNTKRNEAHQFYLGTGFKEIKQQKVFELKIDLT